MPVPLHDLALIMLSTFLCQSFSCPPLLSFADVNECEMGLALCGEAQCENDDGSFLCICPNDNEEFDPIISQCRSLGNRARPALTVTHRT